MKVNAKTHAKCPGLAGTLHAWVFPLPLALWLWHGPAAMAASRAARIVFPEDRQGRAGREKRPRGQRGWEDGRHRRLAISDRMGDHRIGSHAFHLSA